MKYALFLLIFCTDSAFAADGQRIRVSSEVAQGAVYGAAVFIFVLFAYLVVHLLASGTPGRFSSAGPPGPPPAGQSAIFDPPTAESTTDKSFDADRLADFIATRFENPERLFSDEESVRYEAFDKKERARVIVCLLAPDPASDPRMKRRFMNRARDLSRTGHPGISALYHFGTEPWPFAAFRDCPGRPLEELIESKDILCPGALKWAADALEAVRYLHDSGLIHGNLSPSSALMTENGSAFLRDFRMTAAVETLSEKDDLACLAFIAESLVSHIDAHPGFVDIISRLKTGKDIDSLPAEMRRLSDRLPCKETPTACRVATPGRSSPAGSADSVPRQTDQPA